MPTEIKEYSDNLLHVVKIVQGQLLSNSYVFFNSQTKEALIIDPVKPSETIKDIIKTKKLKPQAVILTHGHIDHIEGMYDYGLAVFIHKDEMDYLQSPDLNLASLAGISQPSGEADIKGLEDGEVLNLCQSKFKIIQTPGHTSGSICLYVEGILFSGDTLFFDSVGRCDLPGGNCNKLIDSIINKLLVLPDETKVYPGHGPQTTIGREKRYNPFL